MRVPPDSSTQFFAALADALVRDPALASRLRLKASCDAAQADYAPILDYEREAIARGYPRLA